MRYLCAFKSQHTQQANIRGFLCHEIFFAVMQFVARALVRLSACYFRNNDALRRWRGKRYSSTSPVMALRIAESASVAHFKRELRLLHAISYTFPFRERTLRSSIVRRRAFHFTTIHVYLQLRIRYKYKEKKSIKKVESRFLGSWESVIKFQTSSGCACAELRNSRERWKSDGASFRLRVYIWYQRRQQQFGSKGTTDVTSYL